jgi:hypothetical protein
MTARRFASYALFAGLLAATPSQGTPAVMPGFHSSFLSHDVSDPADYVCVGDLNGDGRLDAVTWNYFGNVRTHFGRADGYFDPGPYQNPDLSSGFPGTQARLQDIDGDGKLDFAVCNGGAPADAIVLFAGDGAGGFAPPRTIVARSPAAPPTDDRYADMGFGEFTGDGLTDAVVVRRVNTNLEELAIYAGTPTGAFTYQYSIPGSNTPFYNTVVVARDLDGDGRTDILWSRDAQLVVFKGLAGGGFAAALPIGLADAASYLGVGDFNGDGRLDLATRATTVVGVRIAYANAVGGYDAAVFEPASADPTGFRCGDTDGDGRDEILTISGQVVIQPVDGLTSTARQVDLRNFGNDWAIADVDQDGADDVVAFERTPYGNFPGPSALTVVLSPPTGGASAFATGGGPTRVVLSDVDRDGHLDAVTTDFATNQVSILWGDGAGAFPSRTDLSTGNGPEAVAIARLDADPWPDLVVSEQASGTFGVLRGLGGRAFAPRVSSPAGAHPRGLDVGDVTGDGFPDIAISFDLANLVRIFPGDGSGGFGVAVDVPTGSGPLGARILDLDRDGRLDLVYGLFVTGAIGVRYGTGAGVGAEVLSNGVGKLTQFEVLDADHDGRLDLAAMGLATANIRVCRADGSGGFVSYGQFTTPSVLDLAAEDFDGDGQDELAFLGSAPNGGIVGTSAVTGPGTVAASPDRIGVGLESSAFAVGDLDHDGRPDLVSISKARSTATVVLNRHAGAIVSVPSAPAAPTRLRFASRMPTRGAFALRYDAPRGVAGELRILSARGAVVHAQAIEASQDGLRTLQVTPGRLAAGVYWAEVRQGAFRDAVKFVLLP